MPLAFYLDFATKQEGLRRFIDSKGLLSPRIGPLSCRPLPPSDNKGRDLAVIKQILHWYILSERKIRVPLIFALCDQIRRAIISVPSNLAEGSGRISTKEQLHFYEIAYGSLMEAYNQLIIASDLKYIDENNLKGIQPQIDVVARMLNGLRATLKKKA